MSLWSGGGEGRAMAVKEEAHGTVEKRLCLSSELSGMEGKLRGQTKIYV